MCVIAISTWQHWSIKGCIYFYMPHKRWYLEILVLKWMPWFLAAVVSSDYETEIDHLPRLVNIASSHWCFSGTHAFNYNLSPNCRASCHLIVFVANIQPLYQWWLLPSCWMIFSERSRQQFWIMQCFRV